MFWKKAKAKKIKEYKVGLGGKNTHILSKDGIFSSGYINTIDRYNVELPSISTQDYITSFKSFDEKAELVAAKHGGYNTKATDDPNGSPRFKGEVQKNMNKAISSDRSTSALVDYIQQSRNRAQAADIIAPYLDAIQKGSTFSSDSLFYGLKEAHIILASAPIQMNLARIQDLVLGFVTFDVDREELFQASKLLEDSVLPLLKILYASNIGTIRVQQHVLNDVIERDHAALVKAAEKKTRKRSAL